MSMKGIGIFSLVFIVMASTVFTSHAAGPSEERIRSAYGLILSEADTNKDGKLSVSECKAVYKDPAMAEKNCKFWDADNDGIITEDEYVRQGMSFGKKK
jgi:Ca2+-binding EF-hand superfamily protein